MTIDEAIQHCRDTALSNAGNAIAYLKGGQKMLAESCEKCAAEHEQLARWLTELKQRREADKHGELVEGHYPNDSRCSVCNQVFRDDINFILPFDEDGICKTPKRCPECGAYWDGGADNG